MAIRRNLFFFYGDDKANARWNNETSYRILEENGFTILDHQKWQTLSQCWRWWTTFLQAVRKTGFREIVIRRDFYLKMKLLSTAISILITFDTPFKKLQKNEICEVLNIQPIQVGC